MESLTHETDDSDSENDEARLLFSQVDSDVNGYDYLNVDNQVPKFILKDNAASLRPLQRSSRCPLNRNMMINHLRLYQAKKPKKQYSQFGHNTIINSVGGPCLHVLQIHSNTGRRWI